MEGLVQKEPIRYNDNAAFKALWEVSSEEFWIKSSRVTLNISTVHLPMETVEPQL